MPSARATSKEASRPNAIKDLEDSVARAPMLPGEPVTAMKLVKPGEGGVLAAILPAGMRAISTRIKEETGVGRLILPNDHVDVILTAAADAAASGGDEFVADTLFRNVRVLAIGQLIEAKDGKKLAEGNTATLELTPRQAEQLAQANSMGEISLSLRSIADIDNKDQPASAPDKRGNSIRVLRYGSEVSERMASTESECTTNQGRQEGWQTMRMTLRRMAGALLLAAVAVSAAAARGDLAGRRRMRTSCSTRCCKIPARGNFPLAKRVSIGLGKSMLVQFPFELKDVLVSSPDKVDAVVQASNRVFLIAKKLGQTNAFFFDTRGQQILTLEISVGADLKGLDGMLQRFVPGSNIQRRDGRQGRRPDAAPCARRSTASAPPTSPASSWPPTGASASRPPPAAPTRPTSRHQPEARRPGTNTRPRPSSRPPPAAVETKLVINLLIVEGEEQVMLKVTVAEVQRAILKQFGINLGAAITSGNFATALLTRERAAAYGCRRSRHAADPGARHRRSRPDHGITCATAGQLCN